MVIKRSVACTEVLVNDIKPNFYFLTAFYTVLKLSRELLEMSL